MNEIQLLTKDQINELITILERDYIIPKIKERINLLKETNEYKENYNKIKELSTTINELQKQLRKLDKNSIYYGNISNIDENSLYSKVINSLNIRTEYDIKNRIIHDLKVRLQLITISDFDSIIKYIIEYIDVNKHLYKDESLVIIEKDDIDL